jgi:hypothetical protein
MRTPTRRPSSSTAEDTPEHFQSSFAVIDFGQATRCVPMYAKGATSVTDGQTLDLAAEYLSELMRRAAPRTRPKR